MIATPPPGPDTDRTRLFILGSCVSRDALEHDGTGFELAGYLARTSLASAFGSDPAPPSVVACASALSSSFQRRMVDTDLRKQAARVIAGTPFDWLMLDLIDERFHLARVAGSSRRPVLVTLSAELSRVLRPEGGTIESGSEAHFNAWCRGVDRLLQRVPPGRIIVNPALWARRSLDGEWLADQGRIEAANVFLARMHEYLVVHKGLPAIRYEGEFLADPDHRWGLAPFHYSPAVYSEAMDQLRRLTRAGNTHGNPS